MDVRLERARIQLYARFCDVVAKARTKDADSVAPRRYALISAGVGDTASIGTLVDSGNDTVDKLVAVFAGLMVEVDCLHNEARDTFFKAIPLYGEDPQGITEADGGAVKMVADFLESLNSLGQFVMRCYDVAHTLLQQLYAFFCLPNAVFHHAHERTLSRVWFALADLLGMLIRLDELVRGHPVLTEHWKLYLRTMQMVQHNPAQFNADNDKFRSLLSLIARLDAQLFTESIFSNVYDMPGILPVEALSNKSFWARPKKLLSDMLARWETESNSIDAMPDRAKLVSLMALGIFIAKVGPQNLVEKKFWRGLAATYKKLAAFPLLGDVIVVPVKIILRHCPETEKILDKKIVATVDASRKSTVNSLCELLTREIAESELAVAEWITEMRAATTAISTALGQLPTNQFLSEKVSLILRGANLADRLGRVVTAVLAGHLSEGRTLAKRHALGLFKAIELRILIAETARDQWPAIIEWATHALQFWSGIILRVLESIRTAALASKDVNLDWLSCLLIAQNSMTRSPARARIAVCGLALELGNYTKFVRSPECVEIDNILSIQETVINLGQIFERVTDNSFLYFHRSLLRVYLDAAFEDSEHSVERVHLFLTAFEDASRLLNSAKHCDAAGLRKSFETECFEIVDEVILTPLCTAIENELRMDVHIKANQSLDELEAKLFLTVSKKSKKEVTPILPDQKAALRRKTWITIVPFRIGDRVVDVKKHVAHYLEKTFYNMTAVALHDGETYAQMRQLAAHRYGLHFAENKLPYMTVDQGLDVLMIIRNIQVFVANFNYDINEQIFIERTGQNRSLNVMHVQQVVNSIKTHGMGIVGLAVNSAYQFLKKKFHVFSQFLFDDQIKLLLVKEIRYYRDHIDDVNQMYPVKRADRFNVAIAKLGTSSDNKTFMDKFRELITQIGNTIGFIRLIRSGAVEASAYAAHFIPQLCTADGFDLENSDPQLKPVKTDFAAVIREAGASESSVEIATALDSLISGLGAGLVPDQDYVDMLIGVFAKEFRNYDKFAHLRNFFAAVPPLTLNHVDHMLTCRSKLGRRTQDDADFTFVDDGFCLGIAYILRLLNQGYFFESLGWFDSVFDKFDTEINKVDEEQKAAAKRADSSFAQTLAIKTQRLKDLHSEFEYLSHTMHSAVMLFKTKEVEEDDDEMYLEEF
uniref:Rif1_N domain-containing protein n=1 Tax=Panagrellus redivivus TaxID=6233 RepID=A0A7E4VJA4_PANRE